MVPKFQTMFTSIGTTRWTKTRGNWVNEASKRGNFSARSLRPFTISVDLLFLRLSARGCPCVLASRLQGRFISYLLNFIKHPARQRPYFPFSRPPTERACRGKWRTVLRERERTFHIPSTLFPVYLSLLHPPPTILPCNPCALYFLPLRCVRLSPFARGALCFLDYVSVFHSVCFTFKSSVRSRYLDEKWDLRVTADAISKLVNSEFATEAAGSRCFARNTARLKSSGLIETQIYSVGRGKRVSSDSRWFREPLPSHSPFSIFQRVEWLHLVDRR